MMLAIDGTNVAPAICFESLQLAHAEAAAKNGADVYFASVAKSASGMERAYAHYSNIAKPHEMIVIAANAVGPSDNFVSAGQSAVWNSGGECTAYCNEVEEALLIIDRSSGRAEILSEPLAGRPA